MGLASTWEREARIGRRRMVSEWNGLELGQLFYADAKEETKREIWRMTMCSKEWQ
jgi:hypothetical protein